MIPERERKKHIIAIASVEAKLYFYPSWVFSWDPYPQREKQFINVCCADPREKPHENELQVAI